MGLILGTNSEPASVGSLQFYGSATGDQGRVKLAVNSASITANIGGGDFTIEMWIAPSATASDNPRNEQTNPTADTTWTGTCIFYDRDTYSTSPGHGLGLGDGIVHFGGDDLSANAYTIAGTTDLRDGNWHFIAVTRDISTGVIELYVDGTREATASAGLTGDMSMPTSVFDAMSCGETEDQSCDFSNNFMVLGAEKHDVPDGAASRDYVGLMSQFRLSDSVRYTGTSMTVPTSPLETDANTVLLYNFSEQAGTTVGDTSGDGNDGTIFTDASGPTWNSSTPY